MMVIADIFSFLVERFYMLIYYFFLHMDDIYLYRESIYECSCVDFTPATSTVVKAKELASTVVKAKK